MKRTRYSTWVRQGQLRVRSTASLVIFASTLAAVSSIAFGNVGITRFLWWAAGLFMFLLVAEAVALRRNRRKEKQNLAKGSSPDRQVVIDSDFHRMTDEDGSSWKIRRFAFDGYQASIQVSGEAGVFEAVRAHATYIFESAEILAARFNSFLEIEAERNSPFANEIRALRVDYFLFVSKASPGTAEVRFTDESGGVSWRCYLSNAEFHDLVMEN